MKVEFIFLILILMLSVLVSGCTETESMTNNDALLPGTDDLWEEGEELDTEDIGITDEQNISNGGDGVEPITLRFTQNDSGMTTNAIKGDTLIITLEENPTTGYSWNLSASPGLSLVNESYEENTDEDKLIGAGGTHQWQFEVEEEEEQNISAVYKRPWEDITGNETQFNLTINVIPKDKLIKANGTVNYIELESGFYGITDKNGTQYDPVNLSDELRKDGLEIFFVAYPVDDRASIHMWGQLIHIREATVIG